MGKSGGERIRITPCLTQDNSILLEVSSLQNVSTLRRYILDKHSLSIKALPNGFEQFEDLNSLPHVDRLTGSYKDDNKENWAPVGVLHVKLNIDNKTITKYCVSARKLKGFDRSGRLNDLYNEADVIETLKANNLLSKGNSEREEASVPYQTEEVNSDDIALLEEYERTLLSGQIMSYEEFMSMKEGQI